MSNRNNPPSSGKYQLPEDKFYTQHGVAGPERIAMGDPDAIMNKLRELGSRTHGNWVQGGVGGYIECRGCPEAHGHAVGPNDMLMGTAQDGQPILKKLAL